MKVTGGPGLLAIYEELAAIVRREEQSRLFHSAVRGQGNRLAEIARANWRGLVRLALREPDPLRVAQHLLRRVLRGRLVQPDPFPMPIGRVEQSHRPARRLAPSRRLARVVPHPHLPKALLLRAQRLACVADLDGLVCVDLTAVPQVALVGLELVAVAGDQDLVAALGLTAGSVLTRVQDPAQARLQRINAQRVFQILAAQLSDDGSRCRQGRNAECRAQQQPCSHTMP